MSYKDTSTHYANKLPLQSDQMIRKGIHYDVGFCTNHNNDAISRKSLKPAIVRREMEIIKNDLHCNAIRITGEDYTRLTMAAEYALRNGLEVWLSPMLMNGNEQETLDHLIKCAKIAEKLRLKYKNIIFVAGSSLAVTSNAYIEGETYIERIETLIKPMRLLKSSFKKGNYNKLLNEFLRKAVKMIRMYFNGTVTYASAYYEDIQWKNFDIVGVNLFRDKQNHKHYKDKIQSYFKYKKPVVITAFGCCSYEGAEKLGELGWSAKLPEDLKLYVARDEKVQADYLAELLHIFTEKQVAGTFAYTFVSHHCAYHNNPEYNLDTASFGIVKPYLDKNGQTYEDMMWEPKKAFYTLATFYKEKN